MKKKFLMAMAFGILAMLISCATTQNQYSIQEMVEKKDYAALRNLMFDESVNVNDLASYGETALAIAVKNNYRDIIDFLFTIGADPNIADTNGETPIFHAVRANNIELTSLLISKNADVNVKNNKNELLLNIPVLNDQSEMAALLVKSGADTRIVDVSGKTVMENAVEKGESLVQAIVTAENINQMTSDGQTILNFAVENARPGIVEYLLKTGSYIHPGFCRPDKLNNVDFALKHTDKVTYAQIIIDFVKAGEDLTGTDYEYVQDYVTSPDISGFYNQGGFPLHHAAAKGHRGFVEYFILKDLDLNRFNQDGLTPLHLAIDNNHQEIIDMLVARGADVNITTPDGDTALLLMLEKSYPKEAILALLETDVDINARNNWGDTPLLMAVGKNYDSDIVARMIQNNSDINVCNNSGNTPLHLAVANDNRETIELLLNKGANIHAVNNELVTPFTAGLERGFEYVSWLCGYIDPKSRDNAGNTLLHLALLNGSNVDIVKLLLLKGTPLNQKNIDGDIPLHIAIRNKQEEAVKLLIDSDSDLFVENKKGETPIVMALATQWGDPSWLAQDKFLKARDAAGNTPLHFAVQYDLTAAAQNLIALNAETDVKNHLGRTPLHVAIIYNNKEMLDLLLSNGVDGSVRDNAGNSAYHYVVLNNRIDLIPYLVRYKLDYNVANTYGKTPLHEAVSYKRNQIVDMLLKQGADVTIRDNWGRQPLHDAVKAGNIEGIQMLIAAGAPIGERDNAGNTPLHHAIKEKYEVISRYLLNIGSDVYAVNKENMSPLSMALLDPKVTEWFIDKSLLASVDNKGRSPLHIAIEEKSPEAIIQILVKKEAELDKKDMDGNTPLHYALNNGNYGAAKVIVNAGADIFIRNKDGMSPLYIAMSKGTEILDWLITDYNINLCDNQGNTPLHIAAIKKDSYIYDYLIRRGASPGLLNKDGYTALQLMQLR